jgi:hypothetical protein
MTLPALRLVYGQGKYRTRGHLLAQKRIVLRLAKRFGTDLEGFYSGGCTGGSESPLNLARLPDQLARPRRAIGDFQCPFPGAATWPAPPGYERSICSAMIWPTAFNFCRKNRPNEADNDINQNDERDFMARFSGTARSWMKFCRFRLYQRRMVGESWQGERTGGSQQTYLYSLACDAILITQRLKWTDHAGDSGALA